MMEGFGSKCCMNFQGFTNSPSAQRTTLHTKHCGFAVFFPTMEVKPNLKYSQILAFLVHGNNRNESIVILLEVEYVST